jgi:hypothetical protein
VANVKVIGGSVVNTAGVALVSKTVTLKNDDTNATLTTTTTNADGEWEFADRDETIRYRAEAAFGGGSSQVVVRKPASAEFDHLYANLSFRTAAAATVALGGPLTLPVGSAAAPSLTFAGDTNSGLYRAGEGQVALVANGVAELIAQPGGVVISGVLATNGQLAASDGTAGAPGISFTSDPNTGVWHSAEGTMTLVSNGATQLTVQAGGVVVAGVLATNGQIAASNGTLAAPGIAFGSDPNTGVWRSAEGEMTLVTNGVARLTVAPTGAEVVGSLVVTSGQLLLDGPLTVSGNTILNNPVTVNNTLNVGGTLNHTGTNIGFFNAGAGFRRTVTGAKGGNTALASLISALVNYGLILDTSST